METYSSTEMHAFCLDIWPQLDDFPIFLAFTYFYLYTCGINYLQGIFVCSMESKRMAWEIDLFN